MSNTSNQTAIDIFSEYVKRRKAGAAKENAVSAVKPLTDQLTRGQRLQLSRLIQLWEARDGQQYQGLPVAPPENRDQPSEKTAAPLLDKAQLPAVKPFVIRAVDPAAARDPSQRQPCPNCGRTNSKNDLHCFSCGHVLESARVATKALQTGSMDPQTRWGSAYFGPSAILNLAVRGAASPLEIEPRNEMVVGRSDKGSVIHPEIDLQDYNAADLGVSRLHASIRRMAETLAICDLDSMNGTFINGQRLLPHEIRALHDGDEIRLGRLVLRAYYKQLTYWAD